MGTGLLSRRNLLRVMSASLVVPSVGMPTRPDAALVPAYFPPDVFPLEWEQLSDPRLYGVVLNVAGGPGDVFNPVFKTAARQIELRGGTVAGYVDMAYAQRDPALILQDVQRYRDWYHVSDFFCDQVPSGPDHVSFMQETTRLMRESGAEFVAFNHGAYPDPGYDVPADLLVTFEGPLSAYLAVQPPDWTLTGTRQRFCHLIYDVQEADVDGVLSLARQRNVGIVFVTDRSGANPYDGLPSYFTRLLTL